MANGEGFDPRPCARGDLIFERRNRYVAVVSIHAPARGATSALCRFRKSRIVSIHAPARGATFTRANAAARYRMFRSTPLREGRLHVTVWHRTHMGFDPRPCARGDFDWVRIPIAFARRFDPRPCARGDNADITQSAVPHSFRSTPLREGRQRRAPVHHECCPGFDPRPCARGDQVSKLAHPDCSGFDPRPCARGDPDPLTCSVHSRKTGACAKVHLKPPPPDLPQRRGPNFFNDFKDHDPARTSRGFPARLRFAPRPSGSSCRRLHDQWSA